MIGDLLIWYIVFVFSTTCHEAAHAWVAYRFGDLTAYAGGHVTLDPVPHIRRSPLGMVVIPILSFWLNGWMVGWASVPVNPHWAARHPKQAAVMSLAGPAANLLLATLALVVMRALLGAGLVVPGYGSISHLVAVPGEAKSLLGAAAEGLSVMLVLNLILGIFNLIPLPPLDGASVLEGTTSRVTGSFYQRLREIPGYEMLGLLVAWQVFPYVSRPVLGWALSLL
jgi:Zn-dependent protease